MRTIEFNKETPSEFKIENHPFNIGYEVLEDNEKTDDYELSQITVDKGIFKGEVKLSKDIIELIPTFEDIDKNITITLAYNGKKTSINVKFTKEKYYMRLCEYGDCKDEYDISFKDNKGSEEIILYTNILKDYEVDESDGKIVIKNKKSLNDEGQIVVTIEDPSVASIEFSEYENDTTGTSYVIRVIAKKVGSTNVKINGEIYGEKQEELDIAINVISEHIITISPNKGFFRLENGNSSENQRITIPSGEKLDLSKYPAYMEDSVDTCKYFTLLGWSKDASAVTPEYKPDEVILDISEDMTLYAIYKKTSEIVDIPINKKVYYLADTDVFGDKLLVPGSKGSHVFTFENDTNYPMTITAINLEEDTICVGENKCLNMGYILKQTVVDAPKDNFYLGRANDGYLILNDLLKSEDYTQIGLNRYHTLYPVKTNVEIPKGKMAEITLLWEWVDKDDLDSKIGNSVTQDNDTYELTISIEFEKKNEACIVNKE